MDDLEANQVDEQTSLLPARAPVERGWSKSLGGVLISVLLMISSLLLFFRGMRLWQLKEELSQSAKLALSTFSLGSIYDEGVEVTINGSVIMDYSPVQGTYRQRVVTTVANWLHNVQVDNSTVAIYLVDTNEKQLDRQLIRAVNASVPPLDINIRPGQETNLSFTAYLHDFASPPAMGTIVQKLLSSDSIMFAGTTDVVVRKAGIGIGPLAVKIEQTLENKYLQFPQFNIFDISLNQADDNQSIEVSARASAFYEYPIRLDVPGTKWEVGIDGCRISNTHDSVPIAQAITTGISLVPKSVVEAGVTSVMTRFSTRLLEPCTLDGKSPLDHFVDHYLRGATNCIHIKGSETQSEVVFSWLADLLTGIALELPFVGKAETDELLRKIQFKNVRLDVPSLFRNPITDSRFNADVRVTAQPPDAINISRGMFLEASRVRGVAVLVYEQEEFAQTAIEDWIPCDTSAGDPDDDEERGGYNIDFSVESAPLNVTDQNVFGKVVRQMLFKEEAPVHVNSTVDVEVNCAIGRFTLSGIVIEGDTDLKM